MLKENDSKYILQTVKNAGRILNLFTIERSTWRLSEISNELDLDISHVRRLLTTMVQENILKKVGKTYSLGFSVLHLSGIVNSQLNIHLEARPILLPLVEKLGTVIHLGVLEGIGIIYLDKLETSHPLKMVSFVGKSHPVYSTGCGKAILAFQKEEDLKDTLQKIEQEGIEKTASRTVADVDELRQQLSEIRRTGFAVTYDEFQEGIASIAAPIFNYNGEVIAAAGLTGSTQKLCGNQINLYISTIVKAAKDISKKIGFSYY